jgi:hypothetical protein
MHRLLPLLLLLASPAAHAGDVKIIVRAPVPWPLWWLEQPRGLPVSRHHLSAPARESKDACTFVAGVRHCPLPPRAEPQ